MVAPFSFDQLAGMRVFVDLDYTRPAMLFRRTPCRLCGRFGGLWIKDRDDFTQALVIGLHQPEKFLFEFHFTFETGILFHGFQLGDLLLECFFRCAKLCKSGHYDYSRQLARQAVKSMLEQLRLAAWIEKLLMCWECSRVLEFGKPQLLYLNV